jgi:hypothetical protein
MSLIEIKSLPAVHNQPNDGRERKGTPDTIPCPRCGKEVVLSHYGTGWVGLCCDNIIYNSSKSPKGRARLEGGSLLSDITEILGMDQEISS